MGAKITVEEIRGKSDAEILAFEQNVVKDMKDEVKAIYQERKAQIEAGQAAGAGAAAQDPSATTTSPSAAPTQEEVKEEVKADPSASAV